MKPEVDEILTRAISERDLRLEMKRAKHTPGVRCVHLYALDKTLQAYYAEGCNLDEALEVLANNYAEGANPLASRGTVARPLSPVEPLDAAVYGGCEVTVRRVIGPQALCATLDELVVYRTPADVAERVRETGVAERHVQRGLTYETVRDRGIVTRCVNEKWDVYPWSWTMRRFGEADTLGKALEKMLAAEPFEVKG